jgi:hypothetical protein
VRVELVKRSAAGKPDYKWALERAQDSNGNTVADANR